MSIPRNPGSFPGPLGQGRWPRAVTAGGLVIALGAVLLGSLVSLSAALERPRKLVEPYRYPLDFKHFYDFEDLTGTLQNLAREFPELTELRSIGSSREGREIWMIRVTDETQGEPDDKPAIFVDGNIHGNEIQGTEVCLYVINELINRVDRDPMVQRLLRERTFYIVPCVNPDSRVRFFSEPNTPHSPRANRRPYDDDRDGRVDEDGPDDLNGDGVITMMRVPDPYGRHRTGEDPRELVRREPDENGEWTLYWWEGIDNDGDGSINEDSPGGVDLNRNFPADWQPPSEQWGAGPYPTSEPEIHAIVSFIHDHPNIAASQSFHNSGNMILYPFGGRPNTEMPRRDRQVFESIAERGQEILPDYDPGGILDFLYRVHGSTVDFAYLHHGAMAFTNELWAWILDYDDDGQISMAERLRWSDERLDGEAFVEWTPFEHPELGAIEIGGWSQFHSRVPPIGFLEELCRLNSDFVLFHADAMPRLEISRTEVSRVAGGVVALDVFVANTGVMDTWPQVSVDLGLARPVRAEIRLSSGLAALEGSVRPRVRAIQPVTYDPIDRRTPDPQTVELGQIQGGSEKAIRWLIHVPAGSGEATVTVSSTKAGTVEIGPISLTP